MISPPVWILPTFAALVGLLLGVVLAAWRARRIAMARKRLPRRWPLDPRLLANTEERLVWHWLSKTFLDHHVMVKIPVTRFTLPRSKDQSLRWYNLLSGVYCTLTVCATDGHVVGCVDVPVGPLSRSNRRLKQALLSQCGIAYWVVESRDLPTSAEIRGEFLGETTTLAAALPPEQDHVAMTAARDKLRAAIERQRQNRSSDHAPLSATGALIWKNPDEDEEEVREGGFSTSMDDWQQPNSFVAPLDSRQGDLR